MQWTARSLLVAVAVVASGGVAASCAAEDFDPVTKVDSITWSQSTVATRRVAGKARGSAARPTSASPKPARSAKWYSMFRKTA